MKKRILAGIFSVMLTIQTGAVALAAGQEGLTNLPEIMVETEIFSASGEEYIFQQGAMGTAYYPAEEEAVLSGAYPWEATFREKLAKAMEACETVVYLDDLKINSDTYGRDVFLEVYWDEINRNPQCFYISGYVSWSYDMMGNYAYVTLGYTDKYIQGDDSLDKVTLAADKQAYEKRVEEALAAVDENMTDVEKLLVVHDFLVRECDYDYGNYLAGTIPKESYSAFGAFVNNTAVCNGYTLALIDCMNRLEIPNYYVSSDAINHAWNMVYLDGNWYHVDATWDDPITSSNSDYVVEGRVHHSNFVLSDKEITATGHKGWSEDLPDASNDNSYEGYIFRDAVGAINYYDGVWYYQPSYYEVVASDIMGIETTTLSDDTYYRYMHGTGDAMYLADNSGIYKLSAPKFDVKEVRIFTEEADYANSELTEFTIKNRQFVAVLQDDNTGEDTRLVFDIEDLETIPDTYTVFFDSNGGSEVTEITDLEAGATIAQPKDPVWEGYKFLGWYKDVALTMPWNFTTDTVTENIVLHAKWEIIPVEVTGVELSDAELTLEIGDTYYLWTTITPENATDKNVTWSSSNSAVATVEEGVVTALAAGSTTITATTANGKTASCTVTVIKADNGENTNFEIGDVATDSWMWSFVKYAYDNDIMSGVGFDANGKVIFAPDGTLTREQFAQVIFNKEGALAGSLNNPFSDVKQDWYTDAVLWANEKGIASGYDDGRFGISDKITREQLAMMLYNYADYKGYDLSGMVALEEFADVENVSEWAETALQWAVANEIMAGMPTEEGTMLKPKGEATRAQCATMIYNFIEAFE